MDLGIKSKVALITGAGRGLGHAIARSLAREGADVIAVSRTEKHLISLMKLLPNSNNKYLSLDLEHEDAVDQIESFLKEKNIKPDIIVNNAGGNLDINDPLCSSKEWRRVFKFNLELAVEINHRYIPYMQQKKWGRICHISSIAGLENQGSPPYCAAKAALNAYVRSVGRYVSPDNVIMTSILPGAVLTEGGYWDVASRERPEHVENYLSSRMAIKRFGEPKEISELVAFMCSEHASFCVGTNLLADGGQGRVFYEG
jgi:3-oxoacyl-[acyl-carrier protein] reductase